MINTIETLTDNSAPVIDSTTTDPNKIIHIKYDAKTNTYSTANFTWKEITCNQRGGVVPKGMYTNILPTLQVLQNIRDYVKVPIHINSSYRCEAYNKRIGGAKKSMHIKFKAIDFSVQNYTPEQYLELYTKIKKQEFGTIGGVGLYNCFIHIDCGPRRDWNEQK